jgi:hypothetical protein
MSTASKNDSGSAFDPLFYFSRSGVNREPCESERRANLARSCAELSNQRNGSGTLPRGLQNQLSRTLSRLVRRSDAVVLRPYPVPKRRKTILERTERTERGQRYERIWKALWLALRIETAKRTEVTGRKRLYKWQARSGRACWCPSFQPCVAGDTCVERPFKDSQSTVTDSVPTTFS